MRRRTVLGVAGALLGSGWVGGTEAPMEMAPKIQTALALTVLKNRKAFEAIRLTPEPFL